MPANKTEIAGSVAVARNDFLNTVAKLAPQVLQELRSTALPHFQALFRIGEFRSDRDQGETGYIVKPAVPGGPVVRVFIRWRDSDDPPRWKSEFVNIEADPVRARVKQAVLGWGAKWNLIDPWTLDAALDTLLWWMQHPADPDQNWHGRVGFLSGDDLPPRLVINELWLFEPWDDLCGRLQEKIASYKAAIQDFCVRNGYNPDATGRGQQHNEWLALYQVCGYSADDIVQWYLSRGTKVTTSAIAKGYQAAANRVGLTLRARKKSYTKNTLLRRRSAS